MKLFTKMAAEWCNRVSMYALLLVHFLYSLGVQAGCTNKDIKHALEDCDRQLAYINWSILSTTDRNYTKTCQWFADYVLCIEPRMYGCKSTLLNVYHDYKEAYSSAPYRCRVPEVPQSLIEEHRRRAREEERREAMQHQMLLTKIQVAPPESSSSNCCSPSLYIVVFSVAVFVIFGGTNVFGAPDDFSSFPL